MRTMTMEEIARMAPAALATKKAEGLTKRYKFIPTAKVINDFDAAGWKVVNAKNTRKNPVGFHVLRFREEAFANKPLVVGDSIPEIVLSNSHNGKSAFKLMAGFFRLVCSNGLTVSDGFFESIRIRHARYSMRAVRSAVSAYRDQMQLLTPQVEAFRDRILTDDERFAFAKEVFDVRWSGEQFAPGILSTHRFADGGRDLWTTLNVVQENVVRGRFRHVETGNRVRKLTAAKADLDFNRALFDIAKKYLN